MAILSIKTLIDGCRVLTVGGPADPGTVTHIERLPEGGFIVYNSTGGSETFASSHYVDQNSVVEE